MEDTVSVIMIMQKQACRLYGNELSYSNKYSVPLSPNITKQREIRLDQTEWILCPKLDQSNFNLCVKRRRAQHGPFVRHTDHQFQHYGARGAR